MIGFSGHRSRIHRIRPIVSGREVNQWQSMITTDADRIRPSVSSQANTPCRPHRAGSVCMSVVIDVGTMNQSLSRNAELTYKTVPVPRRIALTRTPSHLQQVENSPAELPVSEPPRTLGFDANLRR